MKLRKCQKCNSYTLKDIHCDTKTVSAHSPKFKLNDKYGNYRRIMKGWENGNNQRTEKS